MAGEHDERFILADRALVTGQRKRPAVAAIVADDLDLQQLRRAVGVRHLPLVLDTDILLRALESHGPAGLALDDRFGIGLHEAGRRRSRGLPALEGQRHGDSDTDDDQRQDDPRPVLPAHARGRAPPSCPTT
jgi:hypothetical protein